MSLRNAGTLLGVSRQRVHQIIEPRPARKRGASRYVNVAGSRVRVAATGINVDTKLFVRPLALALAMVAEPRKY